jgi:hypothetical protein
MTGPRPALPAARIGAFASSGQMLAPYAAYRKAAPTGRGFCSERCAEAYRRSPEIYAGAAKAPDRA